TRKVAPAPATDSLPDGGGNPLAPHRRTAASMTARMSAQSAQATRIAVRVSMGSGLLARHYAAYAEPVPLRVVLAEDNFLVREGVQRLLAAQPDVDLVATCGDLDALLAAVGPVAEVVARMRPRRRKQKDAET